MIYFDFHLHPPLKTFLGSTEESKRENCWKEVKIKGVIGLIAKFVGDILNSQSSLTQIQKGKVRVAVAGIYPLEHGMTSGVIPVDKNAILFTKLKSLAQKVPEISAELLTEIEYGEYPYFQLYKDIRDHLLDSGNINIVSSHNQVDLSKTNIILAIEGGHALLNNIETDTEQDILNNLEEIKNFKYRTLYLTLVHLTKLPFCTHAFGIKFIENPDFFPEGKGITNLGFQVIEKALDNSEGKKILIDVKHMSLQSRLQYYNWLKEKNLDIPIIASHCAATGCSYKEMPVYKYDAATNPKYPEVFYVKPNGMDDTQFNPWSVNLYDEDIKEIVASKGLIGLNFDQRIQGVGGEVGSEIFSEEEFACYKNDIDKNLERFKKLHKDYQPEDETLFDHKYHLQHLANNILYMVKKGGHETWKCLCIGSDFDGLINALDCYKTIDKFSKRKLIIKRDLYNQLVRIISKMTKGCKDEYFITDLKKQIAGIMFDNAMNFIRVHF